MALLGGRRGFHAHALQHGPHLGDLLLLGVDDGLGHGLGLLIIALLQLDTGHVDGALVMRDHHQEEVGIHHTRGLHGHVLHHGVHGTHHALHVFGHVAHVHVGVVHALHRAAVLG